MKKRSLLFLVALSTLLPFNSTKAQGVEEGNIIINPFYGSPSIPTLLISSLFDSGQEVDFNYLGPVGVSFEYMFNSKIGLGLEGSFSSTSISTEGTDIDGFDFKEKIGVSRIRIYPKLNFHFGDYDKVDPYFSLGGGFKTSNISVDLQSDNPDAEEITETDQFSGLIPISFRMALGSRFYFSESVGASIEFGFGGGMLAAGGLVFKL